MRHIATIANRYGAFVIADEIHAPLTLPGTLFTPFSVIAAETGVPAITLTSASKGWNIPGLKCSALVAHGDVARDVARRLPAAMLERTGHWGVHATIAAFHESIDYLDSVVAHLDAMRLQLQSILDNAGLRVTFPQPEAGYLAFLDCSALHLQNPAATFLKRGRVALYPGERFGDAYMQWARFNYATSSSNRHRSCSSYGERS